MSCKCKFVFVKNLKVDVLGVSILLELDFGERLLVILFCCDFCYLEIFIFKICLFSNRGVI